MKNQIVCAIKKDIKEYLQTRKNILFSMILFSLCAMVLVATKFLPSLISELVKQASHMISNTATISDTLAAFFPENLRANMGILASDIAIFYGIVVILSTYNLIVKEINDEKWIFPLSTGYKPSILLISKGLVFGVGAALPSIIFYNLYFIIGNIYLTPNYNFATALINSLVLGFAIFSIVYLTIMLSLVYKQAIMSALTMILFLTVAPDIFSLFTFGKYLPTYLLTFVYTTSTNIFDLIIPFLFTIIIQILLTFVASKKIANIEVSR